MRRFSARTNRFGMAATAASLMMSLVGVFFVPAANASITPNPATSVTVTSENDALLVSWTAPVYNGSPIGSYRAWARAGGALALCSTSFTTTSCTITGLSNGEIYSVTVDSTNADRVVSTSAAVSGTPGNISSAPRHVAATPSSQTASVSWSPPSNEGGLPLTGYTATADDGSDAPSTCTTPAWSTSCDITGLTNGTRYSITVTATNSAGTSSPSASVSVTPAAAPDAPNTVSLLSSDGTLSVSWSAPSENGSSITNYNVTAWDGASNSFTCSNSDTNCDLTGLTNGTTYSVTVTATNSAGTSLPSTSITGTPATTPGGPTDIVAVPSDGKLSVSWTVPSDGGSPITGYTATATPGTATPVTCTTDGSSTSCDITGLTNGVAYVVSVSATNAIGTTNSDGTVTSTPAAAPDAPTDVAVLAQSGAAFVSWTSAVDNGAAITDYTITLDDGVDSPITVRVSGLATSAYISGLTNGTTYSVVVTATNPQGSGPGSSPLDVTPANAPGAPTDITVTPSNATLSVSWTAPSTGGSDITGYTVTADDGIDTPSTCTTDGSTTTCDITGLTNGTAYSVSVSATNAIGTTPSTGSVTATPATTPDAPTSLSVTPGNGTLTVTWGAPEFNGGATISAYTVTADNGVDTPTTCTVTDGSNACTLTGLTNGSSYSVSVTATNAQGVGAATDPVDATPSAVPDAPTSIDAVGGDSMITVNWTAPDNTGGADITGYTATAFAPGYGYSTCTGGPTDTTCDITDLVNGVNYTITVIATNATGDSVASSSTSATPAGNPTAPTGVTATAGNTQITVSWSASHANGSDITAYTASTSDGSSCDTTGALTCVITGLTNGTSYSISVVATNGVGDSDPSTSVSATPATVPSVPGWLHGVAGNHTATLLWNPSLSNGGAHIDSYVVTDLHGHGCTTSGETCTVTGLTNGTTYIFYVSAHNVMGYSANSNSNIVIPLTTPTAPSISAWHPGNHQIILTVTPPANNGGKPCYYEYSVDGGVTWVNAQNFTTGNTVTAGLLVNGTVYHVTVRAVNQAGHSPASNSVTATPSTVPLAPIITSLTTSASSTVIHLGALSTGGSAITAIQYSLNGGNTWSHVSASASTHSITIAALPLNHTVNIVVRAVNTDGPSPSSASVTARRLK